MKECEFIDMIERIDTKPSTDQKITEQLLNYDASSKQPAQLFSSEKRLCHLPYISKIAAACILIALFGTTTAIASNFFLKTYHVDINFKSDKAKDDPHKNPFHNRSKEYKTKYFGRGPRVFDEKGNLITSNKKETTDERGNIYDDTGLGTNFVYNPQKSGEEAFKVLGLPNLTPTYLYDNYILDQNGYMYMKSENKGTIQKKLAVEFITHQTDTNSKFVYIEYYPNENDKSPKTSTYVVDDDPSLYSASTYTTKGGLICNIVSQKNSDDISAQIEMKSDTLGSGTFLISFSHIDMDEIKVILDSLPITTKGITK